MTTGAEETAGLSPASAVGTGVVVRDGAVSLSTVSFPPETDWRPHRATLLDSGDCNDQETSRQRARCDYRFHECDDPAWRVRER